MALGPDLWGRRMNSDVATAPRRIRNPNKVIFDHPGTAGGTLAMVVISVTEWADAISVGLLVGVLALMLGVVVNVTQRSQSVLETVHQPVLDTAEDDALIPKTNERIDVTNYDNESDFLAALIAALNEAPSDT